MTPTVQWLNMDGQKFILMMCYPNNDSFNIIYNFQRRIRRKPIAPQ